MKKRELERLAGIVAEIDGGCSACIRNFCDSFNEEFKKEGYFLEPYSEYPAKIRSGIRTAAQRKKIKLAEEKAKREVERKNQEIALAKIEADKSIAEAEMRANEIRGARCNVNQ